ncbi:MAG: hypothetical protein ACRDE2_04855 [Chitinophagaceae bacterium]
MKKVTKTARVTTSTEKKFGGFTNEEKAAMRARAKELKAGANKAEEESAALEAIARMKEPDRTIAGKLHKLILSSGLSAKTWYGMPAYANKEGKVVCYFRDRQKFKERYAMFGFNDPANLDEGSMWPIAFALPELTAEVEAKIVALVKKAVK